jgi:hypothetical protein
VDPLPAELARLQRSHEVQAAPAPVVYGLVFDLYLADATECARVHQQLTSALRAAMLPGTREGMELAAQELSPGCSASPGSRRFDRAAFDSGVWAAQQRFGAGRVRPVLVYFNNLALPLPSGLRSDLQLLRDGSSKALVWALTLQPASATGLPFDLAQPWTHSADPALSAPLEKAAAAQLPLEQVRPPAEGFPVFTASELTTIREFKGCTNLGALSGLNFTYGPRATKVSAAAPPRVTMALPAVGLPTPRGTVQALSVRYEVEVCRANCERTYEPPDGEAVFWNTTSGCQLKAAS